MPGIPSLIHLQLDPANRSVCPKMNTRPLSTINGITASRQQRLIRYFLRWARRSTKIGFQTKGPASLRTTTATGTRIMLNSFCPSKLTSINPRYFAACAGGERARCLTSGPQNHNHAITLLLQLYFPRLKDPHPAHGRHAPAKDA